MTAPFTGDTGELVDEYRRARDRLNGTLDLIDNADMLREQLWWGLDLDEQVLHVDAFKRDCLVQKRGAR